MDEKPEITVRIVLVGDTQVGKTSILSRYLNGINPVHPSTTVGVNLVTREIECDNFKITISYCDTAGQEKYRAIGTLYYKNADAAIVVFDVTNKESCDSLSAWIQNYRDNADKDTIIIAANKCDLKEKAVISMEDSFEFAQRYRAHCVWTSAVDGTGIDELFNTVNDLVQQAVSLSFEERHREQKSQLKLDGDGKMKKKCC